MKKSISKLTSLCVVLAVAGCIPLSSAQKDSVAASTVSPLTSSGVIDLPNVKGRIDHFAVDPLHNRLFVAALGNNTVEIIDLTVNRVVHSISGVPTPQGVVYSPETNKLFVGSDKGRLYIYDGTTFNLVTSIDFGDDVDNLRYIAKEKRVYVGYGNEQTAAIGMVDAATNQRISEEFKLGAHPESFQLATAAPNIYVNLPNLKQIAVVNRTTHSISRWPLSFDSNFPMALDENDHRLFVATRNPARLLVFDTGSGRIISTLPSVQDADDLYYDHVRKRLYIAGGEGYISVVHQDDAEHYKILSKLRSTIGARTAGYFEQGRDGLDRLYLAVPAQADRKAAVWIYNVKN